LNFKIKLSELHSAVLINKLLVNKLIIKRFIIQNRIKRLHSYPVTITERFFDCCIESIESLDVSISNESPDFAESRIDVLPLLLVVTLQYYSGPGVKAVIGTTKLVPKPLQVVT
jgi:hypothetical protein